MELRLSIQRGVRARSASAIGASIEWHCRLVEMRCAQNLSYRLPGNLCKIRHTESGLGFFALPGYLVSALPG